MKMRRPISLAAITVAVGQVSADINAADDPWNAKDHSQPSKTICIAAEHHFQKLLMVTSASHVPRAAETFHGVGLEFDTLPVDYRSVDYAGRPVLLLMGNEQQGLPDDLAAACDRLLRIPQAGRADSLNLAVASGVMLFEIRRAALKLAPEAGA